MRREELICACSEGARGLTAHASRHRALELDELTAGGAAITEAVRESEARRVIIGAGAKGGDEIGRGVQREENHAVGCRPVKRRRAARGAFQQHRAQYCESRPSIRDATHGSGGGAGA
jgi:hypothetical protein